ncbi:MAG TPA: serine/threonine-protein kinase, partial [Thermoanaerobaculia bacterium]|nr:serine/threonine-protein kinase [Thermoanaerobaculia bacterium]
MEFRELTERYDLEKILRSGRTSTVMRAADRQSGQTVAVKMIQAVLLVPPDGFPEAARRFQAYAAALAVLHHPCLPETLDAGITPDGSAFLVTEMVEGRGLDTLAGKLPPPEALALLEPMLDALEALASRGMAHGNLSPDNVLLLDGGQVKLLGLGSAVFRTGKSPAPAESARFMAPEVAQGAVPSARSDLYSYGRTVCHLLGASVAPGDSPSVQLPFPVTLEVANDAPLREILEKLLRKDPAERPVFLEVRTAFAKALGTAAPTATPAVAIPEPEPVAEQPIPEGNVFLDITDELLDSLQG